MSHQASPLAGVEVYIFDVFGTVVDWYGNITKALAAAAPEGINEDWHTFTTEWRTGYFKHARRIAAGGEGTTNMDKAHRQILDTMLESPRWSKLGSAWDSDHREALVKAWHKANGWPDSSKGIYGLKKKAIVAALSNGNIRFLVDLAKHSDLPFDVIFSVDFFGTCKPNEKVYQGALHHLDIAPEKCAMVACHLWDLRAAAQQGMKTVYVPRDTDDEEDRDNVKSKAEGGEVDVVVSSLEELAEIA
ncbi:haloacid dehalogenase [Polyporus arcularius HHB13444]|uniref:Haloacid dehalogenase n=1 Tax=Polyporus arcularius HHB13444 TaxID=1314778 RepID=A0A5C3NNL1_9APHY|nr:haloacid dehalogenase [Polyporus arcularius HHB13444]